MKRAALLSVLTLLEPDGSCASPPGTSFCPDSRSASNRWYSGITGTGGGEYGHIDILVNNAGLIRREDAIDFTEKRLDDVKNLNIKSVFFMSQAAANILLPVRQRRQNLHIIAPRFPSSGGIRAFVLYRVEKRRNGNNASDGERVGEHNESGTPPRWLWAHQEFNARCTT